MMTIKGFAQLCQCSPQTLRYYDQVGLLRPARVDKWSGYRYYDEKQVVDFVKIRNLQAADFSIEEIKALLVQPDQAIYDAFERKIAAQREKLDRIIQIQHTYLHEKTAMEKISQSMTSYLLSQCRTPELLQEFGYPPEEYDLIMAALRTWMEQQLAGSAADNTTVQLKINDEVTQGVEEITERIAQLNDANLGDTILLGDDGSVSRQNDPTDFETVWEKHGWAHVRDFIDEIPPLTGSKDFMFNFFLNRPSSSEDLSFEMFMLGIMLIRHGNAVCLHGCHVDESTDGMNHFILQRQK